MASCPQISPATSAIAWRRWWWGDDDTLLRRMCCTPERAKCWCVTRDFSARRPKLVLFLLTERSGRNTPTSMWQKPPWKRPRARRQRANGGERLTHTTPDSFTRPFTSALYYHCVCVVFSVHLIWIQISRDRPIINIYVLSIISCLLCVMMCSWILRCKAI